MGYPSVSQFVFDERHIRETPSSSTLPQAIAMDNSTNFNHSDNLKQII
jgi:hypothetical protein